MLISAEHGCKDQESIQSTTPDPGYQSKSDKLTVRHHKREPRGQPFPSRCRLYKMMQASKANESVFEYSMTGLCITVKVLPMI